MDRTNKPTRLPPGDPGGHVRAGNSGFCSASTLAPNANQKQISRISKRKDKLLSDYACTGRPLHKKRHGISRAS